MQSIIALALFIFFIVPVAHSEELPTADQTYGKWRYNPDLVVGYPDQYGTTALKFRIGPATITSQTSFPELPFGPQALRVDTNGLQRDEKVSFNLGHGLSVHAAAHFILPNLPRGMNNMKPGGYIALPYSSDSEWRFIQEEKSFQIGFAWKR